MLYEAYTIYMVHWPIKAVSLTKYSVCFVKYLIAKMAQYRAYCCKIFRYYYQ